MNWPVKIPEFAGTPQDYALAVGVVVFIVMALKALRWQPRWPGGRKAKAPPEPVMLWVTPQDPITLHQLYESCLITGGIGSAKTTGPGALLAEALLNLEINHEKE